MDSCVGAPLAATAQVAIALTMRSPQAAPLQIFDLLDCLLVNLVNERRFCPTQLCEHFAL